MAGGVFDDDRGYCCVELRMAEVVCFELTPYPVQYGMYYLV
jgi:glutamine synthetase